MDLTPRDHALLAAIQDGLPVTAAPYATVGHAIGMSEAETIERLGRLIGAGIVKRLGLIVRHHELGYRANAMAVWDVPDAIVDAIGRQAAARDFVTLCYRRRRAESWPYNLYCMIHGRDRATVLALIGRLSAELGIDAMPSSVLFSLKRFKQRGATYYPRATVAA